MASLSNSGATHPPRSNPPLRSSSGPPSPCITPSTVTIVLVVSFMIAVPFSLIWGRPRGGPLLLLRTPPPRSDTACPEITPARTPAWAVHVPVPCSGHYRPWTDWGHLVVPLPLLVGGSPARESHCSMSSSTRTAIRR